VDQFDPYYDTRESRLTDKDIQPLQSVKTIITVMLTDTNGLDSLLNRRSLIIIVYAIHYSCLHDHAVI